MAFLLGFLGVVFGLLLLIFIVYAFVVYKFNQMGFKGWNLFKIKEEIENNANNKPRQLGGMTNLLLPQILKDFPDFDIEHLYLLKRVFIIF